MPSSRRTQAFYGAAVVAAALAALVTCNGIGERAVDVAPPPIAASEPAALPSTTEPAPAPLAKSETVQQPSPIAARAPAKKKTVSVATPAPKKKKKKLLADVDAKDFVVSNVSVSESGYKARIEGYVRMTRKGALAQPLMTFDLTDGNGSRIHSGTFTPMDASGPAWIGYDELGLKRVPFTTTVDLRADGGVLPAVPPRPYSASVRVAEVIDAKPAKTR